MVCTAQSNLLKYTLKITDKIKPKSILVKDLPFNISNEDIIFFLVNLTKLTCNLKYATTGIFPALPT